MRSSILGRPTDILAELTRAAPSYQRLEGRVFDELRMLVPAGDVAYSEEEAAAAALNKVIARFVELGLTDILSLHGLPWPRYPVYGPDSKGLHVPGVSDASTIPMPSSGWNVLGFDVGFPIGIPSCELTSSPEWIEYYAREGFNILTFRTVRSEERKAGQEWRFLDGLDRPWELGQQPGTVHGSDSQLPPDWRAISTLTPFSAPSPPPHIWRNQIRGTKRRLESLGGGHLLIVSVTDSVKYEEKSDEKLAEDFVRVAGWAEEAGANVVECYLARSRYKDPATGQLTACQYSPKTSLAIVSAVRARLSPETKILIKLGDMPSEALETLVVPLVSRGYIDGVSGISPVRVQVADTDGRQVVDNPPTAPGVAGLAVRNVGVNFVKRLADIRQRHHLSFDIIGMGGVMTPYDVATYRRLGAAAVQTATAARCKPGIALAAYMWDRRIDPNSIEDWEGVVEEVDGDVFVARLTDVAGDAPDEQAEFDLGEVSPAQRSMVKPGAVFRWWSESEYLNEDKAFLRRSEVQFRSLRPPTEEDAEAGEQLVQRAHEASADPWPFVD